MPTVQDILGFANRWYKPGFEAALCTALPSGLVLRHLSAPYFMATKLEAFKDRGNNDVYLSHDLEDIMTVLEGRAAVAREVADASAPVRQHVAQAAATLLQMPAFHNALPGLLSDPEREPTVKARLAQIARLKD